MPGDLRRPDDQGFLCLLYTQQPINLRYHIAKFGGHKHWGCEDIMILVCHMNLEDHVIKRLCDFMGRRPSSQVTIVPDLTA